MSTIFSQQIFSCMLLQVVIVRFKLEPITTYQLWFVVKVLWKCCEHITSLIVIINNFPSQMVMKFVVNSKYNKVVLMVSLVAQKKSVISKSYKNQ